MCVASRNANAHSVFALSSFGGGRCASVAIKLTFKLYAFAYVRIFKSHLCFAEIYFDQQHTHFSNIVCSFFTVGRGKLSEGVLVNCRGDCTVGGWGACTSASGRSSSVSRTHSLPQHLMNRHLLFCIWCIILTAHIVKLARRPPTMTAISSDAILYMLLDF